MAERNAVQVLIGGKVITLSGYESTEYLEKVASYMNQKQKECSSLSNWRRMSSDMKATLLTLNVADDYFKAKQKAEELEEELRLRDQEAYELKQELVDLQMKLDGAPARSRDSAKENQNSNQNRSSRRH
ncbi:MAG: cell division protein ZapA [Lachnospiraceae bacterium]|nr:cell division protein ZapA [Lachnospiraceae bacterium]